MAARVIGHVRPCPHLAASWTRGPSLHALVIQARAVLGNNVCDFSVGIRVDPYLVESFLGVVFDVVGSKRLGNVTKGLVLPAVQNQVSQPYGPRHGFCLGSPDQDVPSALVVLDNLLDTLAVIAVARRVNLEAKVLRQRRDGVEWAFSRAV